MFDNIEVVDVEPRTLEIIYSVVGKSLTQHEVVFEDPTECHRRPRLLASLESVLALKTLCEQEFGRIETLTSMLNRCRTAYYKELLWLREQLLLAARPDQQMLHAAVKNYEVYWFDPPQYVDADLKEFIQECVRCTTRKLIEENYELSLRASGAVTEDPFADSDAALRTLTRRLGAGQLVRRLHGLLSARDSGLPGQLAALEEAMAELLGKPPDADNEGLLAELGELRARVAELDELRLAMARLKAELEAARQLVSAEAARANMERDRAEAQRLRAERAEELARQLAEAAEQDAASLADLAHEASAAAKRLASVRQDLAQFAKGSGPGYRGPGSPRLPEAVAALEAAVAAMPRAGPAPVVVVAAPVGEHPDLALLRERIRLLEQKLAQAREAEAAARRAEQAARAALEAQRTAQPPPAALPAAQPPTPRPEPKGPVDQAPDPGPPPPLRADDGSELARFRAETERRQREAAREIEALLAHKLRLEREVTRLETLLAERSEQLKLAQDAVDELAMKLSLAQDKIRALKEELRRWKLKCGVTEAECDAEESDGEEVDFLVSYTRRVRNSAKPRWQLLNEDYSLLQKKREFLFAQRFPAVTQSSGWNETVGGRPQVIAAPEWPARVRPEPGAAGSPARAVPNPTRCWVLTPDWSSKAGPLDEAVPLQAVAAAAAAAASAAAAVASRLWGDRLEARDGELSRRMAVDRSTLAMSQHVSAANREPAPTVSTSRAPVVRASAAPVPATVPAAFVPTTVALAAPAPAAQGVPALTPVRSWGSLAGGVASRTGAAAAAGAAGVATAAGPGAAGAAGDELTLPSTKDRVVTTQLRAKHGWSGSPPTPSASPSLQATVRLAGALEPGLAADVDLNRDCISVVLATNGRVVTTADFTAPRSETGPGPTLATWEAVASLAASITSDTTGRGSWTRSLGHGELPTASLSGSATLPCAVPAPASAVPAPGAAEPAANGAPRAVAAASRASGGGAWTPGGTPGVPATRAVSGVPVMQCSGAASGAPGALGAPAPAAFPAAAATATACETGPPGGPGGGGGTECSSPQRGGRPRVGTLARSVSAGVLSPCGARATPAPAPAPAPAPPRATTRGDPAPPESATVRLPADALWGTTAQCWGRGLSTSPVTNRAKSFGLCRDAAAKPGILAEVLPPLPAGRTRRGAPVPLWLVPP